MPGFVTAHEQHPRPLPSAPPDRIAPGRTEPAAAIERRWRAVIRAELHRLRRRRPGMAAEEIRAVETALDRIADRLLLSRLRDHPYSARHLAALLDLDDVCHGPAGCPPRPAGPGTPVTQVTPVAPAHRARPHRGRAGSWTPDGDRDD